MLTQPRLALLSLCTLAFALACGGDSSGPPAVASVDAMVSGVMHDVRYDSSATALAGGAFIAGPPDVGSSRESEATSRQPRLRRLRALWPLVVFAVVVLYFAVAGLSR